MKDEIIDIRKKILFLNELLKTKRIKSSNDSLLYLNRQLFYLKKEYKKMVNDYNDIKKRQLYKK